MIQQKRANLNAPASVNGLEKGTRPLMSKRKKQSQGLSLLYY